MRQLWGQIERGKLFGIQLAKAAAQLQQTLCFPLAGSFGRQLLCGFRGVVALIYFVRHGDGFNLA
jgi:hypothetical protein